jgi:hypothetical protein
MHATHYIPRLFCQRIWNKSGLALFAGSIVLATVTETEESNMEIQPEKVAAEEDLQAQQNASLPTAQRSALETELKKAQERAQLAEKMADLAEKKLGDLEAAVAEKEDQLQAELKQAQERARLAEKYSDLSDPNTGPKAEALALIQTSDSSVQSAETTARPGPASNSAPAPIEFGNEENKGIGFAKATLIAVETNPAPKNDPLTPDQQPVRLVRINQSRSPVPLPTPSAHRSAIGRPGKASVRFYKDVLGLEIVYGGERSYFNSLRTKDGDTILNLEHRNASIQWRRLIFHVSDVDRFWAYLMEKGFHPDTPHDASWGERYFAPFAPDKR